MAGREGDTWVPIVSKMRSEGGTDKCPQFLLHLKSHRQQNPPLTILNKGLPWKGLTALKEDWWTRLGWRWKPRNQGNQEIQKAKGWQLSFQQQQPRQDAICYSWLSLSAPDSKSWGKHPTGHAKAIPANSQHGLPWLSQWEKQCTNSPHSADVPCCSESWTLGYIQNGTSGTLESGKSGYEGG